MQLSIQSTTTSASMFAMQQGNLDAGGRGKAAGVQQEPAKAVPATNVLDLAAKKAEEDAVVISALQDAVEKGKTKNESDAKSGKLASVDDYLDTADKIRGALGDGTESRASAAYESASITETTIEGEIGGQKISASFVSFERVSYNSQTGLTSRSASAMNIEVSGNGVSSSYQSASVSSLYAGTDKQIGNLISGFA